MSSLLEINSAYFLSSNHIQCESQAHVSSFSLEKKKSFSCPWIDNVKIFNGKKGKWMSKCKQTCDKDKVKTKCLNFIFFLVIAPLSANYLLAAE